MNKSPNARVVSVSQVTEYLRILTESDRFLSDIWIEGEVTKVYTARSGHVYFSLSDGVATIGAVAYRTHALRMMHALVVGQRLVVGGRVSVFQRDGICQVIAEYADATGMGMQALELARLRARLEAEGLFDRHRKRPLPAFPKVIGVATSPAGAVIHDIMTVLRRRFPFAHLLVAPCQVQGEGSPDSVVTAIDLLIADGRPEVIIVARGGGSAEDLAAFNDERIARAAFACPVPLVSAIGHESNSCILDDVADVRAPTPSAAAELCTPDVADFALEAIDARDRLARTVHGIIAQRHSELQQAVQRIDRSAPSLGIGALRELIDNSKVRSARALRARLAAEQATHRLNLLRLRSIGLRLVDQQRISVSAAASRLEIWRGVGFQTRLNSLSDCDASMRRAVRLHLDPRGSELRVIDARLGELNPTTILGRGFSLLTDQRGEMITSIQHIRVGDRVVARLIDGTIDADVVESRAQAS